LRALTDHSAVEAELDEELLDYFERAKADLIRQGLTPEEAARTARRELGDIAKAREALRSYGWEHDVNATLDDLRHSIRRLRQSPGFAVVVMLTLAVGIGVNVALFSLFQQILLRPLPVPEPDRLVNLGDPGPKLNSRYTNSGSQPSLSGGVDTVFSYGMFRDLERAQAPYLSIAAHRVFDASLSTGMQARLATGAFVSGSYFTVLGLEPALGRLLISQDDRTEGAAESVVLSHAYWLGEFGGDRDVLGSRLIVNGVPLTIVGVGPPGFHGTTVGARASVFVPITFPGGSLQSSLPNHDNRGLHWIHLFARLEPGMTLDEAATAMDARYRAIVSEAEAPLHEDGPDALAEKSLVLELGRQGQSALLAPVRVRLAMLFAVSGSVLLLCCANVAGLLLVRGTTRIGEMAVRASIGATRARLARLLAAESLTLALPAALLCLPVALLVLRGIASAFPDISTSALVAVDSGAAFDVGLSLHAAVAAVAVAIVSALAFGLFPIRALSRAEPRTTMEAHGARLAAGKGVTRFRTALATAQIALSMALLAVTFVFAQSLVNISRVDLGFDVDSVAMFSISPETSGYSAEAAVSLYDRLEEGLAAIPGVSSTASGPRLLTGEDSGWLGFSVDGVAVDELISIYAVRPGFFRTVGIELLAGRDFRDEDYLDEPDVAIVNRRFAERLSLGDDVIGRRIELGTQPIEIVGLVADAKDEGVTSDVEPQVFAPFRPADAATFYVRGDRPGYELLTAVRETVTRIDPIVPITNLRTMERQVRESLRTERFVAGASMAFAALATVLAGIGLYGVLAYAVGQRSREIALRLALGAQAGRIRAIVLRPVAFIAATGVALGIVAALLLGHASRSLLFGVEAADPAALAAATGVVASVVLAAAYIPARRASRVDPLAMLRHE